MSTSQIVAGSGSRTPTSFVVPAAAAIVAAGAYGTAAAILLVALSIDTLGTPGSATTPLWYLAVLASALLGMLAFAGAAAVASHRPGPDHSRGIVGRTLIVAGSCAAGLLLGMWAGFLVRFGSDDGGRLLWFTLFALGGAALGMGASIVRTRRA